MAAKELPGILPGHWETDEGSGMAKHYLAEHSTRDTLHAGHLSDFMVAHQIAMTGRGDLAFEGKLLTAKDRIRWLSAQLALANMPRGRMEPVDLGYCLFCATRCVERDPMGWLHADKEPWIKMAQDFMRLAELKP